MIHILFFARLREQLGCSNLDLDWSEELASVKALRAQLQSHSPEWAQALGADNIVVAVNQQQVDVEHAIAAGDEVAFFPPVTGG